MIRSPKFTVVFLKWNGFFLGTYERCTVQKFVFVLCSSGGLEVEGLHLFGYDDGFSVN